MKTTSSERRLHPATILFETGRLLPRLALPMVALLFATWERRGGALSVLIWIGAIIALVIVTSILRYLRFSYRYDERELVIRSGMITRNERSIPYVRIQNLDAAQNLLHRLLGVVMVYVQTGGGAEPEASLRVLPVAALDEMRARVLAAAGRPEESVQSGTSVESDAALETRASHESDAALETHASFEVSLDTASSPARLRRTLLTLEPRDLLLAGFIENRGMVLIVGALALLEQAGVTGRIIERLFQAEDAALAGIASRWLGGADVPAVRGALYVAAALLAILLFIRLLSTVWAVIRLYGFRVDRVGDDLHTEYGLFTRVTATIPLRRIQTVIVRDGVLHRRLGLCTVAVETAGGIVVEAGAPKREPIAPILRVEQLPALLDELQAGLELDRIEWQPVHPRAFGRMMRGSLFWPAALSAAAYIVVQEWAFALLVSLTALAFLQARLRARNLAWSLTREGIVVRDGALTRTTRIAHFNRVQVAALYRNPFDVRTGMARVRADTAGARGGVVIPY
ncbi:MAG: PH domain-containing protein, partial [Longimicrobiales bacterium]